MTHFYSGNSVSHLLKTSKKSKAALSKLIGVTPATITRWMSYKEKPLPKVPLAKVKKLEQALKLKVPMEMVEENLDEPLPNLQYSEEKKDWIKKEEPYITSYDIESPDEPEVNDNDLCHDVSDDLIDEIKYLKKIARELYFKLDELCDQI